MAPQQTVTIEELIDRSPWSPWQKVSALLAACAIMLDGLDIQILGFAVPSIAKDWHLAKSSFSLIFALSLLAVAAGTVLGGFLGDRFGRRPAIILAVLWFGISTLLLATSPSLAWLYLYRILSGLGIGAAIPNAAAFIAETTPARYRTTALTATIVCIPLGGFLGGTIASHVLVIGSWRMLLAVGGVLPVVLGLILWAFLPESPRLLATLHTEQAKLLQVLRRFRITLPGGTSLSAAPPSEIQSDSIALLLKPAFRRDTLSLWAAFCFCLVSIYFVFNWLPSMLSTLGLGPAAASQGLAAYNLGGVLGSILVGIWINRQGSRIPLLLVCAAAVGSALWLALHLVTSPAGISLLRFQLGFHGFCANAVQTTLYALAAYLYPTRMRSRGVAMASAFGRAGAISSAFIGGIAIHHSGPTYFYILAVTLTATGVCLLFMKTHIAGTKSYGGLAQSAPTHLADTHGTS